MKKSKEIIKFEFPTWDDDIGHSEHETVVIGHNGDSFVTLNFINKLIEGFNCHLSIIPKPIDKKQTKLVV